MKTTLPAQTAFDCAESPGAQSVFTAAAVEWLQRIARDVASDRYHFQRCNDRKPLSVTESATIRGRKVELRLFISRHGATYCKRWRVDGHSWTAAQVNQAFGL